MNRTSAYFARYVFPLLILCSGCGDQKTRGRIARLDDETLIEIQDNYPLNSKAGRFIAEEMERRNISENTAPSAAVTTPSNAKKLKDEENRRAAEELLERKRKERSQREAPPVEEPLNDLSQARRKMNEANASKRDGKKALQPVPRDVENFNGYIVRVLPVSVRAPSMPSFVDCSPTTTMEVNDGQEATTSGNRACAKPV